MRLELESPQSAGPFPGNAAVEPVNSDDAADSLREGIKAAQEGNRGRARMCLKRSAELDAQNENTWLWLASISDYPEELLVFLDNVLGINPENTRALEWTVATKSLLAKNLVQRGIDAAESGQPDSAMEYFNQALEHDQQNSVAWLWMASVTDSNEEKMAYLEKVLSIEPENEAANTAYQTVKLDSNQKLFAMARTAAVTGMAVDANDLIDLILAETPDSEEAWVLRSHLAGGFEEKISCFEKVLSINPDSTVARSTVDSLQSIIAAATPAIEALDEEETKIPENQAAAEDVEAAANVTEEYTASELSASEILEEIFVPDRNPTNELQFPEGISEEVQQDMMNSSANIRADLSTQTFNFSDVEYSFDEYETDANIQEGADVITSAYAEPLPPSETIGAAEKKTAEPAADEVEQHIVETGESEDDVPVTGPALELDSLNKVDVLEMPESVDDVHSEEDLLEDIHGTQPANYDYNSDGIVTNWDESLAEEPSLSAQAEQDMDSGHEPPAYDSGIPMPYAELPDINETAAPAVNPFEMAVLDFDREGVVLEESSVCPFCTSVNDSHAFSCQNCMAMLTLSDLEMLLANQHADKFVLRDAVEKMEREKTTRQFNESELTMLGIGHLNLRNLQSGYAYLNEASHLNPNNVVLASQVNALLIRLEEIKNQEIAHEAMPKGKKILVVDDSPTVRKLIAGKLEKSGHDVFCSNDGVEAMERLQDLVPDLVLLDITMPRMDGYQVCKLIRTNEATKNVPVVMISGKDGFFDKVRGRMAGTSGYITKPFGPETLMKAVETYLQNSAQVPKE